MGRIFWIMLLIICAWLLTGCGVSQSDYDTLNAENEKLKKELDELRYGADRLLTSGKEFMNRKDYVHARNALELLVKSHPGSKQAMEAENLLAELHGVVPEIGFSPAETVKTIDPYTEQQTNAVTDDGTGITWYYDNSTPKNRNVNNIHLYYGRKGHERPVMRLRIQYAGNDRLYLQGFNIRADNISYNISIKPGEVETGSQSGSNWESYDTELNREKYNMIKAIMKSQTTSVRCIGKEFYDDFVVSESEKQALKSVLGTYTRAGGKLYFR
jgi:hypothetical protein